MNTVPNEVWPSFSVGSAELVETIPFLIQADTAKHLQDFFEGPIPKVGDAVELYCYEVTEKDGMTRVKMKWRVVAKT